MHVAFGQRISLRVQRISLRRKVIRLLEQVISWQGAGGLQQGAAKGYRDVSLQAVDLEVVIPCDVNGSMHVAFGQRISLRVQRISLRRKVIRLLEQVISWRGTGGLQQGALQQGAAKGY